MNEIEKWLDKIAEYEDVTSIERGIVNTLRCIEFQRFMSKKNGYNTTVLPTTIGDISVGDVVYANFDVGYPCELWGGHWCYILKDLGNKYLVVPSTSVKDRIYHKSKMIIDTVIEGEITQSCLDIDNIRAIDKNRISSTKAIGKVLTPKSTIRKNIFDYLKEE